MRQLEDSINHVDQNFVLLSPSQLHKFPLKTYINFHQLPVVSQSFSAIDESTVPVNVETADDTRRIEFRGISGAAAVGLRIQRHFPIETIKLVFLKVSLKITFVSKDQRTKDD